MNVWKCLLETKCQRCNLGLYSGALETVWPSLYWILILCDLLFSYDWKQSWTDEKSVTHLSRGFVLRAVHFSEDILCLRFSQLYLEGSCRF